MPGSKRSRKRPGGGGGFRRTGGSGGASMWRVERGMLGLMIATVAVFVVGAYWSPLLQALLLDPVATLKHGQLWRLVTSAFVHGGFVPFLLGVLGLWWIGSFIERAVGTSRALFMFFAFTIVGSLVVASLALWTKYPHNPTGSGAALFGFIAASAFIYGPQPVLLFGAKPARADIVAWIFCGIILFMELVQRDFLGACGDLAAGVTAWFVSRGGMPSFDLGTRWARLRLWWLRRRYKVLDGGKSSSREKKWMN